MNRIERENREKLFKLMQENRDLPVVAMVDAEIVAGDDFGRWMGSWGSVQIDEYLIPTNCDEPMMFKSDDDVFDVLERCLPRPKFEALPETEEECRPFYDALPWKRPLSLISICRILRIVSRGGAAEGEEEEKAGSGETYREAGIRGRGRRKTIRVGMLSRPQQVLELAAHLRIEELAEQM